MVKVDWGRVYGRTILGFQVIVIVSSIIASIGGASYIAWELWKMFNGIILQSIGYIITAILILYIVGTIADKMNQWLEPVDQKYK